MPMNTLCVRYTRCYYLLTGVDILFGDGSQPHIVSLYMEEACSRHVSNGRTDRLTGMYDLHTECIHRIASVIPYKTKN